MERSILELMAVSKSVLPVTLDVLAISFNALAVISYTVMLLACILFVVALVKFHRASKTKLRSDYAKAFRFSGHGFFALGCLQAILLSYLDSQLKINALYAAIFFIVIGIITAFIGDKLKPKR
jgi:amino acid transporter